MNEAATTRRGALLCFAGIALALASFVPAAPVQAQELELNDLFGALLVNLDENGEHDVKGDAAAASGDLTQVGAAEIEFAAAATQEIGEFLLDVQGFDEDDLDDFGAVAVPETGFDKVDVGNRYTVFVGRFAGSFARHEARIRADAGPYFSQRGRPDYGGGGEDDPFFGKNFAINVLRQGESFSIFATSYEGGEFRSVNTGAFGFVVRNKVVLLFIPTKEIGKLRGLPAFFGPDLDDSAEVPWPPTITLTVDAVDGALVVEEPAEAEPSPSPEEEEPEEEEEETAGAPASQTAEGGSFPWAVVLVGGGLLGLLAWWLLTHMKPSGPCPEEFENWQAAEARYRAAEERVADADGRAAQAESKMGVGESELSKVEAAQAARDARESAEKARAIAENDRRSADEWLRLYLKCVGWVPPDGSESATLGEEPGGEGSIVWGGPEPVSAPPAPGGGAPTTAGPTPSGSSAPHEEETETTTEDMSDWCEGLRRRGEKMRAAARAVEEAAEGAGAAAEGLRAHARVLAEQADHWRRSADRCDERYSGRVRSPFTDRPEAR